jgi:hypothetical protein
VTLGERAESQPLAGARYLPWLLVALVIVFVALIRLRLLQIPLERDEGEYAYAGQLILQGIPPYQIAFNMKFPGTYAAYAAIMAIFGQNAGGIHLGFLLINAGTIVLVYLLGKRVFSMVAGVADIDTVSRARREGMNASRSRVAGIGASWTRSGSC